MAAWRKHGGAAALAAHIAYGINNEKRRQWQPAMAAASK
jgi:hypothetical protein